MAKLTRQQWEASAEAKALRAAYDAAKAQGPANAAATNAAWAAMDAAAIAAMGPMKRGGYSSRAGKRQQQVMEQERLMALQRRGRR